MNKTLEDLLSHRFRNAPASILNQHPGVAPTCDGDLHPRPPIAVGEGVADQIVEDMCKVVGIHFCGDHYRRHFIRQRRLLQRDSRFSAINRLSHRYFGRDYPGPRTDRVTVRIEPERVTGGDVTLEK